MKVIGATFNNIRMMFLTEAALIGLLTGVYPANRAVKLSPIEAMRNN